MSYIIYTTGSGQLIGVSVEPVPDDLPGGISYTTVDGDAPDLNKSIFEVETCTFINNSRLLTKLEFMTRFSPQERILVRSSTDTVLQDFLKLLDLAEYIDLDDSNVIDGLNYIVYLSLITEARVQEILS